MKLKSLVLWSLGGIALSVSAVVAAMPSLEPARARASALPEVDVEESGVSDLSPSALVVRTRVGHSVLDVHGDRRTFLLLDVTGRASDGERADVATNTALVIDTSGSMAGARIQQALLAARGWVQRGQAGDTVSVTTFSDRARELVPAVDLANGQGRVLGALQRVAVDGSTCISCGLDAAARQLDGTDGRVKRVVLLSDGRANMGLMGAAAMRSFAHTLRQRGVSISTVGVGTSFDSQTMATLAFESNGMHHFVSTPGDLPGVFEREAKGLAATTADGVTADLRLGRGVELVRVLDRSGERTANGTRITFGSIAVGEQRTLMVEVKAPPELGERELASVELSFRDVDGDEAQRVSRRFSCRLAEQSSTALDPLVEMRVQRSATAKALLRSTELLQAGQRIDASVALVDRRRSLERTMARLAELDGQDAVDSHLDLTAQLDEIRRMELEVERATNRERARAATRRMRANAMPMMF